MDIPIGLTFDDVLLRPAESDILPSMADTRTRLTRGIGLNIPILSLPKFISLKYPRKSSKLSIFVQF